MLSSRKLILTKKVFCTSIKLKVENQRFIEIEKAIVQKRSPTPKVAA